MTPRRSLGTRAPGPYRNHQGWDSDEYRSLLTSGLGQEAPITLRILRTPSLVLRVPNHRSVPRLDGGQVLSRFLRESIARCRWEVMARTAQIIGGIAVWNLLEAVLCPVPSAPRTSLTPGPVPVTRQT